MSNRRSPVTSQGPQGPRTMNSLRSRRPPPNLNLIVANPDSEEESSDEERRTAQQQQPNQNQQQVPSKILQQQQQQLQGGGGNGQGVMITAQPPTPGLGGMQGSQSQQRPVDGGIPTSHPMSGPDRPRTSMEDPTGSGMQYRFNASPPPPPAPAPPGGSSTSSSAYPPVPPVNRPGSSGSQGQGQGQGPSPSTQLNSNNNPNNSNVPSGYPVMMTASNVRPNRHPAMERSLPRIHTPPAYPIPLPPSSGVTARPGDFPSGVPAPQQQQQHQQQQQQQQAQQQAYQALAQKSVGGSIGGSPINTSSPSSPSMTYAGSSVTLPLQPGQPSSGGEQTHRRRHEGLPMLPPRPKQQAVPGLVTQTGPSAGPGQSPQRLGSIRLAVTVDNENFSVVDVSGMASAEAIMERVFAKLRFRDDDYPSLTLYRTDIGETPESDSVGRAQLFELCKSQGDAKGSLKFLVMQTSMAPSPSSAAIPPPTGHSLVHGGPAYTLGSPAELSRKTFSASSASGAGTGADRVRLGNGASGGGGGGGGSRHSKSGSVSSTSERYGRHEHGYPQDVGYETSPVDTSQPYAIPGGRSEASASGSAGGGGGGTGNHTLSRHHRLMSRGSRRMPSTSTSKGSQSPADERSKVGGSSRMYGSPPPSLDSTSNTHTSASTSVATAMGSRSEMMQNMARRGNTAPMSGWGAGDKNDPRLAGSQHRPSLPNPYENFQIRQQMESPEADVEVVPPFDRSYDAVDWEPSPSEPTEADMALIQRMQQEEDERERQKRIQMEADMRVAMQEQQKEHAAWEAMQAREQEARQRQVEADRIAAGRAEERERRFVENDRERIERQKREAEALEKERERQVGRERKARRLQWENKAGMWNAGMSAFASEDLGPLDGQTNASPLENRYDHPFGPGSASTSHIRPVPAQDPRMANAPMSHYGSPPLRDVYLSTPPTDPDDPFGAYDGLQAQLPPGATYGYQVEPAYRDRREHSYHTHSGPVPQVSQTLRANRSYANINRSASAQSSYDHSNYYTDSRSLGRHAASHPPIDPDPFYRNDLARVRSAEGARTYGGALQPHAIPALAFPEPHPAASSRMDRRGSESAVQLPSPSSASHSRRASFGQGIAAYREIPPTGDGTHLSPGSAEQIQQPYSTLSEVSSRASEATLQPGVYGSQDQDAEDDSGNTARANQWTEQLNAMIDGQNESTLLPRKAVASPPAEEEDEAEETLFFVPMGKDNGTAPPAKNDATIKPSLTVDTATTRPGITPTSGHPTSNSSSDMPTAATIESDNAQDGAGANLRRAKSFAKTKDQWNFRPPAEDVYDRLEEFFPKIDLDKPVVQAPTLEGLPETAQQPTETIQTPVPKPQRQPGFNKADARKSIRFVAEGRKKHLSKIAPAVKQQGSSLERKRSSSMWGHKVVEVTPAGIEQGKLPPAPVEETVSDDGPVTMTWVKGDLIGKGTYGRVYLALNATTGDMIAVKQVEMPRTDTEREDARQTGMIEALKSEIALLKDLDHPQVVAYLGWEESPEFLSIFLEYVPGGSVASVYRRHKKFEEQVIKSFTMQILDGLAYLHSLNILHRDLKADNILVDHNGTCKISDFGISKRTNDAYDSIISTNLKGSVFWMAPEVVHSVKGQGYSAKVDIWSLGCVVLEMWAGRRPWGDMEALAAMFQLANTRAAPPVPDDVTLSPVADDFLNKKCFAPSPRDRPVAEELLRHPFITDRDPNWTFMDSKIGRAVAAGTKRRRVEPSQG